MSESNLALWRRHCHTNPDETKKVNQRGGYTAINPQSQAERATSEWGPYGMGWGLRDLNYQTHGESPGLFLTLSCEFFYVTRQGDEFAFPIAADMAFKVGDDCYKKLRTQCQSKALSLLGFNADIYAGDWEVSGYQDLMRTRFGDQDNRLTQGRIAIASANQDTLGKIVDKIDREAGDGTLDATVAEHLRAAVTERREVLDSLPKCGDEDPRVAELFDTSEKPEGVGV